MWPSTAMPVGRCPGGVWRMGCQQPQRPAQLVLLIPHRVRLYVDDERQDAATGAGPGRRQRRQDGRPLFQLGGSPEPGALSNLTGCIGNVFVKR